MSSITVGVKGDKDMRKRIIVIIVLLVLLVGCSIYKPLEENIAVSDNQIKIESKLIYPDLNYESNSSLIRENFDDSGGGGGYGYIGRHRPRFYSMTYPFADLVGREEFQDWLLSRSREEQENEHVAVSFIRYFNISREDFEKANEQMRRSWESLNFSPRDLAFASFEIYDVDLIFSFDNERINEYFLWENSPFMSDFGKGMEIGNFRPLFYNMPATFANLVGRETFIEWRRSRSLEERANENIAVSFIRYFDISKVDFTRANEEVRLFWEGEFFTPEDGSIFESYPVDLIFTFDNARINEYFLWENSPSSWERENIQSQLMLSSERYWNLETRATSKYVTVTTNQNSWSVNSNQPWIKLDRIEGVSGDVLTISISENTEKVARIGIVTVRAGTRTQTITITQEASTVEPTLTLSPATNWPANWGGSRRNITITTNQTSWVAESDQPWLTLNTNTGVSGDILNLYLASNLTAYSRVATMRVTAGSQMRTITVSQEGRAPRLNLSVGAWSTHRLENSLDVMVSTNHNSWVASSSEPWLTLSRETGISGEVFTMHVPANPVTIAREATVTVRAGEIIQTMRVRQGAAFPSLSISPSNAWNPRAGEASRNITVTTTLAPWTAESSEPWLVLDRETGMSGEMFVINALENVEPTSRAGIVRIKAGDLMRTITITQAAASVTGMSNLHSVEGSLVEVDVWSNYAAYQSYITLDVFNENFELINPVVVLDAYGDSKLYIFLNNYTELQYIPVELLQEQIDMWELDMGLEELYISRFEDVRTITNYDRVLMKYNGQIKGSITDR